MFKRLSLDHTAGGSRVPPKSRPVEVITAKGTKVGLLKKGWGSYVLKFPDATLFKAVPEDVRHGGGFPTIKQWQTVLDQAGI